jgi:hypothetical protein
MRSFMPTTLSVRHEDAPQSAQKYGWAWIEKYMATKPNFIRGHLPVARSVASGENIATFDASSSVWPFRREGKWEIVARALLEHDELSGNAVKDIIEAASRRMEREDRLDRQRWIEAMADDKREPEPFMGRAKRASSREQRGARPQARPIGRGGPRAYIVLP